MLAEEAARVDGLVCTMVSEQLLPFAADCRRGITSYSAMSDLPEFGTLDVAEFTVGGMLRAGIAIRRIVKGAETVEDATQCIVRYLYDHFADPASGERTCPLVRFYKTDPFSSLPTELQEFARRHLGAIPATPSMRCLCLVATAGEEPEWNDRRQSRSHQAIALPSVEIVREAPMIARLIEELGLDIESVIGGGEPAMRGSSSRTYDVFHVENARGSPHVPAQRTFVEPYGIASVVGFGGLLRSGELYAVVIFSRVTIPAKSAARFRTIALDVRSALYALDESRIWRD